jgi:hypothetical protein
MSRYMADHDIKEFPIKNAMNDGDQMIVADEAGNPYRIIKGVFENQLPMVRFVPTPAHSDSPGNVGEVAYEDCGGNKCWFYIRTPEQWIRFKVNHTF